MGEVHEEVKERKKVRISKDLQFDPETGEIRVYGIRCVIVDPLSSCERADEMLGSGGEVIIHHMWFGQGYQFFSEMLKKNPNKTREEILKEIINVQPSLGWGILTLSINDNNPRTINGAVKNPPVKNVKGSAKRLISSFWAGVFSKYFNTKMIDRDFQYDKEKDEFRFTISAS